ncbi:MAG: hypothetical protein DRR42_26100 [Gammaproteobacteria bacterium]|nr:MAG: hypothetical protein DRR42_26100 [Gammaproteobacteria bacterium]
MNRLNLTPDDANLLFARIQGMCQAYANYFVEKHNCEWHGCHHEGSPEPCRKAINRADEYLYDFLTNEEES